MRVIRGGVEFVVTLQNLVELAQGLPMIRQVRDVDGGPVVVRVSVSGEGRKGLRVEIWGARDGVRSEEQEAKEWEARLLASIGVSEVPALPDGVINTRRRNGPQVKRLPGGRTKIVG